MTSSVECPAVTFMMEEDQWWTRVPCVGSGMEIDWAVMRRLRCRCHGNALQVAIASAQPRFVSYMLGTGYYDVNERNHRGRSPLFDAASIGSTEITEILIRYGAQVNKGAGATTWVNNPFDEACTRGHSRVVELLLQHKVYVREFSESLRSACKGSEDRCCRRPTAVATPGKQIP